MKTLYDGTEVSLDTPTKMKNGKRYLLSESEIKEKEEREIEAKKEKPLNDWIQSISEYDQWIPRSLEETIDARGTIGYSQFIIDKYNEKKELRSKKPKKRK